MKAAKYFYRLSLILSLLLSSQSVIARVDLDEILLKQKIEIEKLRDLLHVDLKKYLIDQDFSALRDVGRYKEISDNILNRKLEADKLALDMLDYVKTKEKDRLCEMFLISVYLTSMQNRINKIHQCMVHGCKKRELEHAKRIFISESILIEKKLDKCEY